MTPRPKSRSARMMFVPLAAAMGLSACCLVPGHKPEGAALVQMEKAVNPRVTGAATYRERMMAPPGSELTVSLQDTSRADAAAVTLAEWKGSLDEAGVPVAFVLTPEAPLDARMTYTVRAVIRGPEGDLLWTTDTANRVTVGADGTADMGELVMVKVEPPPDAEPASPLAGGWIVESVSGKAVTGPNPPTLNFGADGRVSGFGGCNRFSGGYTKSGVSLDFTGVVSTMMACADNDGNARESAIGSVLRGAATFVIDGDGKLLLTGENGTEIVAAPAPKTMALAGTEWSVFKMGSAGLFAGKEPAIAFSADGKVSGTTGCNRLFGSYTQSGAKLVIDGLGMTKMACLDGGLMQQETVFTSILRGESTVSVEAPMTDGFPEKLVITGANGVSFTAAPIVPRAPPPRPMPDRTSLENGEWVVEDINRGGVIDNTRLTLAFGEDGRVSGSTNCNAFSGSFKSTSTKVFLSDIAVTERACLAEALQNQEAAYLAILNADPAEGLAWSFTEDGALELVTAEGKRVLLRR